MNRLSVLVTAVFGLVLFVLLMLHIAAPWQYANDDNGAWFSAIARSHREAGLQATLGQDFFTSRESGELVPYLHHPPFPGLVLAAAFVVTGVDAPWVARTTFALLHLISFLLIARLACQIPAVRRNMLLFAYVLSVVAVVPMSAFYGKMPNHEVPGLLFFLLGVSAWGFTRRETIPRHRLLLALLAWFLAVCSSWHAVFCVVGWLVAHWKARRNGQILVALAAVMASLGLVVLHLYLASQDRGMASQVQSSAHWMVNGASVADNLRFLQHAIGIGMIRWGYLPAIGAMLWFLLLIIDRLMGRPAAPCSRDLLGLCLGSFAYALIFPRAISNHAYQGFYLIPFVALASALVVDRLCSADRAEVSAPRARACLVVVLLLNLVLGAGMTLKMYRKPSARAVQSAQAIESQYR